VNDKNKLAIKAIDEMKSSEMLDLDNYHKCMVELAYQFFKEGDIDSGIQMIGKCQPEYFGAKQLQHMKEDEVYKNIVLYLAYKFIQYDMVDVGVEYKPNQKSVGIA
jgi:hypothetical protein